MEKKRKVLVVDDNIDFCENITDILRLKGFEVAMAHDGYRAFEIVKDDNFDLVLMDVKMPLMDGVETFRRLKDIRPEIPVIMMTAHTVESLMREALREGAYGAFYKPINMEVLLCSIEQAFQKGAFIMVVDDDRDLRTNLHDLLTEKGCRVKLAKDGKTAVQKVRENKLDIILLDMKLPEMNGFQTYLSIREIRPDVVVILITGFPGEMEGLTKQALDKNALLCLEKPLDMNNLLKLMEDVYQAKESGSPISKPGKKEDTSKGD